MAVLGPPFYPTFLLLTIKELFQKNNLKQFKFLWQKLFTPRWARKKARLLSFVPLRTGNYAPRKDNSIK
jgi:hypothetical protein